MSKSSFFQMKIWNWKKLRRSKEYNARVFQKYAWKPGFWENHGLSHYEDKQATRSYKRFCLGKERGFEISFHWISCSGLNYQHIRLLRDQICQLLFPVARMASYFLSATCYHPLSIWWSIKVEFPLKLSLLASCLSHLKSNTFE